MSERKSALISNYPRFLDLGVTGDNRLHRMCVHYIAGDLEPLRVRHSADHHQITVIIHNHTVPETTLVSLVEAELGAQVN